MHGKMTDGKWPHRAPPIGPAFPPAVLRAAFQPHQKDPQSLAHDLTVARLRSSFCTVASDMAISAFFPPTTLGQENETW